MPARRSDSDADHGRIASRAVLAESLLGPGSLVYLLKSAVLAVHAKFTVMRKFTKLLPNHEDREGHEDGIKKNTSNLKENSFFLRALRVLRGSRFPLTD